MRRYALLGQSFGHQGKKGPGKSNEALIQKARKQSLLTVPMALQHEMAACLNPKERDQYLKCTVWGHREKKYLDTEEVFAQEFAWAKKERITDVFILAHPFIHRYMCMKWARKLGEKYGITIHEVHTGWIPFDKDSHQWWTRGPLRLVIYCIRFVVFKYRGGAVNPLDRS